MLISLYISGDLEYALKNACSESGKTAQAYIRDALSEKLGVFDTRENYTCKRCSRSWFARVNDPKYCPMCKSPAWNTPPVSRAMYEGLTELQIGETIKLQFSGIPDPRPMRAVNYQKRRYGKAFRIEGKGQYLVVTRIEPRPVSPIGKSVKVVPPPVDTENVDGEIPV